MPKLSSILRLPCALCLGVLPVGLFAQTLLVVNQGDSNVSLVDPVAARPISTIAENLPGIHGHEIAVSADGRTAYLPIYGSTGVGKPGLSGRTMQVIDVPTRKITATVDFGHEVRPHLPVLDPHSGLLYVTTELDQTISIFDPKARKIVGTIPTGQEQSHMLVLSHEGSRGYTANVGPGTVSVLDIAARTKLAVIPISGQVQRISISNDDRLVFTSDQVQPRLAVIDTATNAVRTWVPLPGTGYGTAPTQDGRWLLVAVPSTNEVAVVNLTSMKVARQIKVPSTPQEILIRPDGKVAYVSCNISGQVATVALDGSPAEWTVIHLIPTGNLADGLAWAK